MHRAPQFHHRGSGRGLYLRVTSPFASKMLLRAPDRTDPWLPSPTSRPGKPVHNNEGVMTVDSKLIMSVSFQNKGGRHVQPQQGPKLIPQLQSRHTTCRCTDMQAYVAIIVWRAIVSHSLSHTQHTLCLDYAMCEPSRRSEHLVAT